ncbi:MAG: InlB B-repeat-containing protein [Salinivirgaceae bacterium]|nr:InlB B-repeat-containing protein [Salinivirgaceae bacterium]
MKKHLLLTFALVLATLTGAWAYDYDFKTAEGAGAVYYKLNSPKAGEATVVAGEWQYRDNVVIDDEITVNGVNYKVTTIGKEAFYYCYDVISVTLGANVTTIKGGAFTRSSGPTRKIYDEKKGKFVDISGIMINIDSDALTTIESAAFSVTTLAPNKGADTLAIGKNVAGLSGTSTFFSWVTYSNISAFYVDPSSTTLCTDDKGALYSKDMKKLYRFPPYSTETSYVIPSSVETTAAYSFMAMQNLTKVTGGENLKTIGGDAVSTKLTTFPVGKNVSSMSTTCFMYCGGSFLPDVDDENPKFKMKDSVLYEYRQTKKTDGTIQYDTVLCQYFKIKKTKTFVVPSMVTIIAGYSFYNVNGDDKLMVIDYVNCNKKKLRTIEGTAFLSTNSGLKFINEQNLFDVDQYGVIYTDGFKGIRLYASDVTTEVYEMPEATTEVPRNVIKSNGYVKDFNINKNCTSINTEHLDVMSNLEHYIVHSQNSKYSSDAEGVLYNKEKTKLLAYPRGNDRIFYKVSDKTKEIGVKAFYNNKNLVGLDLGDKLEKAYEGNAANLSTMNSLQYMRVGVAEPPVVNSNTFSEDMYKRKTILYVPEEYFDIYVNASVWNRFAVVKDTSYFNGDVTSTKYSYYACHYKENLAGDGWESPERVKWEGCILTQTTAEPREYEGFDFEHCEQASLEKKNQEIPFYYTRKEFNLIWKNGDEIVSSGRPKYGTQIEPPTTEITAPDGSTFVGWHYKPDSKIALTFDENSTLRFDTVFYAVFVENGSQQYTVQHRLQDLNNNGTVANTYTVVDIDMGFGLEGRLTVAEPKEYHGFTAPQSIQQQSIAADGSTIVTIDYTRNQYQVTWKNGSKTITDGNVTGQFYYGSNLKKAANQTAAAGYEFVGWNTEPSATVALDLTNALVEDNVTYHAIFKQRPSKTYAVRHYLQNIDDDFYPQLPEDTDIKTGIVGQKTQAEAKTYEGFSAKTFNQAEIKEKMDPVSIYYERIKYQVTWMKDENTTLWTGQLKYGAPLNPPTNPTHDDAGKHFVGWNIDKNATTGMNVIATVSRDTTFYAIFAENDKGVYTVNHYLQNINDDNYPNEPARTTSGAEVIGRTVTATPETITGFSVVEPLAEQQLITAEGTVLNVFYTRNKYQVTWKNGDAAIANTGGLYKFESLLQQPAEELVSAPAGKHLLGWNTNASATDAIDLTNKKVEADESKNVYYAIFADNENREYHVKHYLEKVDGGYPDDPILTEKPSAPFGLQTNATAKTYDGFTAPNSITQQTIAEDVDNPTVITIFYTRNEYPVVWMNEETEFARNNNCKYESSVIVPNNPVSTDDGKHFIGWNTNKNASTILDMTTQTVPLNGVTYHAIYAENDVVQYTIRHHKADLNGQFTDAEGLVSETKDADKYGLMTNAKAATFEGFTAQTTITQQKIKADGTTVVDIYYDRNSYTLEWDANEGSFSGNYTSGIVYYGAKITEPEYSRTGYDFKGWGLTDDAASFEEIPATMPASNLSYIANWIIKEYPVRWNFNNGTGEFSTSYVAYHEPIGVAASQPKKENWHFIGWSREQNGTTITDGNYGIMETSQVDFYAQWEIDEFELTWNANGGEIVSEGTHGSVAFGTSPLTPATVKRTGYKYEGWATSPDATSITNILLAMPNYNLTYYAVWTINSHSLTWNANGGELETEGTNGTVDYGTTITPATTKSRTGYDFIGWNTQADATTAIDVATEMPDNNLTYYAVWEAHTHTLTWDANGGDFVAEGPDEQLVMVPNPSGKVVFGAPVSTPRVDRDGWKMAGWGPTANATPDDVVTPVQSMPDCDLAYYAIWITRDDNIVTWKMNDGTDYNYTSNNVTTNATINAPAGTPEREHYQFIGWAATPDGKVLTDFGIMDSNKKTFYAQWQLNQNWLEWDANGGEIVIAGTSGLVEYGATVTPPTAIRTGYKFVGWNTDADATDFVDVSEMPDAATTYYAIWTPNNYDIKWMFNDGSSEAFAVTAVVFDNEIEAPLATPARAHYEFIGWAATPEGELISDFGTLTTEGATFYAQWQLCKYMLAWDANGGQLSGDYTQGEVEYGAPLTAPTATRANNIFAGWCTRANLDSIVNIATMPDSNVTFVATWLTGNNIVEWRLNDGTDHNYRANKVEPGEPIVAPEDAPERAFFQFLGWSATPAGEVITDNDFGTMDEDGAIFYAQWQINSHALVWNANGGLLSGNYTSGSLAVGDEIVPPTATRTGHTFVGWGTFAEATDGVTIPANMPDESLEFFAIWQVNNYTATWHYDADSVYATMHIDYDKNIEAPAVSPVRKDYQFNGWAATADGDAITDFGTMPDSDLDFYAVWKFANKSVDWMFDADSLYLTTTVNVGDSIKAPAENPERHNFSFVGWAATTDGAAIDTFGIMQESDTAFFAVWEPILFDAVWFVNNGTSAIFATTQASVSTTLVAPDSVPQRENYTFKGWSTLVDGAPMSNIEMPEGGINLYAVWKPNEFTAIWKMNDGTDNNFETMKIEMGQTITAPAKNPTRQYYTFVGWSKSAQGQATTNFGTMTADGAEFFAIWDAIVEFTAPESFVTCEREQKIELSGLSNKEIKFSWSVNGKVDASQTGSTFDIPEDADYSGTITVTGSFGGKDVTKSITYQRKKMMTRTLWNDVITVVNPDTAFASYRWYHNGELVDTTEYYNEVGGLTGKYYLVATTESGVEICSCESDFGAAPEVTMTVFPNPTVDDITVAGSLIETGATISVIDDNGKEWLRKTVETDGSETVRVSQMPQGMYLVKVGDKVVSFIKL